MRWLILSCFLPLFCGCSPNSSEEFHREGKERCRALVEDLAKIENREQLLRAEPLLKRRFESLVGLMIEAREFQQKHLEELEGEVAIEENEIDAKLETELRRIYAIEGGREVVERAQHEALVRLDAYERALTRKRAQLISSR